VQAISACTVLFVGARRNPSPRRKPRHGGGETVYALTKVDQERLVLLWGKQTGNPHGGAALFLHLRAAPVPVQSVHRRDRDLLHAAAESSAAGDV